MSRRVVVIAVAIAFLGSLTAAAASSGRPLLCTDRQAKAYLIHGLRRWSHIDLRAASSKEAFCVSAAEAVGKDVAPRVNRFRSFYCTLLVRFKSGTRVFGLRLTATREGWRITPSRV